MPFGYYDRLSPARQRIYRKSDAIRRIEMPDVAALMPLAIAIEPVLASAGRNDVEAACQALVDAIDAQLAVPAVRGRVLERRPAGSGGGLQGLHGPDEGTRAPARISVWMATPQRPPV